MIPHEQLLVERFRDKPFALLGVNVDANPDMAMKTIRTRGINWRNWRAGSDNANQERWALAHLPTLYVVDAKGIVRYTGVTGNNLDNAVETLLAEADVAKR